MNLRITVVLRGLLGLALWLVSSGGTGASEGELTFSNHLISNDYTYGFGVAVADVDGDGDPDIISSDCTTHGSRMHNDIYWYQNDGKGNFTRHFVAKDDWYGRYERLKVADINGDGHPDVVIVDNFFGNLTWFENSGHPRDGKPWKRHVITEGGLLGAYDVDVADLDGDGRPDVVASSWRFGRQFVWYENPGPFPDAEWNAHVIDSGLGETRSVAVADFNGDGRPDVLGTDTGLGITLWYENPGDPKRRPWKRHVIDLETRPCHGHPVDMDGDGDMDVVMALGGPNPDAGWAVVWYENVGKPGDGTRWVKHTITDAFEGAFEAVAADLDGDGRPEVIASAWGKNGGVAWFKAKGDPTGPWSMHPLITHWSNAVQVVVGDMDCDSRPDVVAVAEHGSYELRWWRNEGTQAQ